MFVIGGYGGQCLCMCRVLVVWVSTQAGDSVAGEATEAAAQMASNGVLTTGKFTTATNRGLTLVHVYVEKKGLENSVSWEGRGGESKREQNNGHCQIMC